MTDLDRPGAQPGLSESPLVVAELRRFTRRNFGIAGTLALHRGAIGWDMLKAPANVVLSPFYLLLRLVAAALGALRLRRTADWLRGRHLLFETNVAEQVAARLRALLQQLDQAGAATGASQQVIDREIGEYATVRNAIAEITTTVFVLLCGVFVFHSATPGVVSLAGPVADLRAQAVAIAGFPLGDAAGRLWYGVFPAHHTTLELIGTAVALAMMTSVITTFAGVLADPIQLWTGMHRRRLQRLIDRLEVAGRHEGMRGGLAREHYVARFGDLSDMLLSLWRSLKG